MKMYILVLDDVPLGFAINSVGHAAVACYKNWQGCSEMKRWCDTSFKKVVCKVNEQQIQKAMELEDKYVQITESALDGRLVCVAFKPREEYNKFFNFLSLYR